MYLASVRIENFRIFGAQSDGEHLDLALDPGLNVLVGENDSGKSSIIDAIRLLLSTRAQDGWRLGEDDFHVRGRNRASTLIVQGTFRGLTENERSRFLEWLTVDGGDPILVVTLQAQRREIGGRSRRVSYTTRTGRTADGPPFEGDVRDFLQAAYLRPLRDAEAEMSSGRGSRLSQILEAHPDFRTHTSDDSDQETPQTLVGIMRRAEKQIQNSKLVKDTASTLTAQYLTPLSLGEQQLKGTMGVARNIDLRQILEKLELWLAPEKPDELRTRRGLGLNNLLFMAAELLLVGGDAEASLPLLLIEEPEAHLHPQLQVRLIEFLEKRATPETKDDKTAKDSAAMDDGEATDASSTLPPQARVQVLLTTHSPQFAARVDLERLIVVSGRQCFSLARPHTKLADADYQFLRRFLDVTKANLFFARGIVIVEGDAENLLLPVIAKKLGRPFSKYGVSIVNVGSRALSRYARIFQRAEGPGPDVRVACVTDLDIVPEQAMYARDPPDDPADDDHSPIPPTAEARSSALRSGDGVPVRTLIESQQMV